jgi:2'-hydroxyisoflavone reductase
LKALCEHEAQTQFPDATLILRPGYIIGAGDPNGVVPYWLLRLSKGGEVMTAGDESLPVQFIDVRDLAEWAIRLVEERVKGIYNAVGPTVATGLGQLLGAASKTVSTPSKLTWVRSAWLASQQDKETWRKLLFFTNEPNGYGWMMRMDNRAALSQGLTLRPMSDTLAHIFDSYRRLPEHDQAKVLLIYKERTGSPGGIDLENISWPAYLEREKKMLEAWHAQRNVK